MKISIAYWQVMNTPPSASAAGAFLCSTHHACNRPSRCAPGRSPPRAQRRAVSRARHTPFQDWLGAVTPTYTWDWDHLVCIQPQLARVSSGEIQKLMLFVPPRHGKSEMTTM
ncbi:MAG TPA: hypothetical protein VF909_07805 [Roseiflexaceae bacterium]